MRTSRALRPVRLGAARARRRPRRGGRPHAAERAGAARTHAGGPLCRRAFLPDQLALQGSRSAPHPEGQRGEGADRPCPSAGNDPRRHTAHDACVHRIAARAHVPRLRPAKRILPPDRSATGVLGLVQGRATPRRRGHGPARQRDALHLGHDRAGQGSAPPAGVAATGPGRDAVHAHRAGDRGRNARAGQRAALSRGARQLWGAGGAARRAPVARTPLRRRGDAAHDRIAAHLPRLHGADHVPAAAAAAGAGEKRATT